MMMKWLYGIGAGLVVPDVPLEETEILRSEASKHGIELVPFLSVFCISHHTRTGLAELNTEALITTCHFNLIYS